jgi:hypothetical protein
MIMIRNTMFALSLLALTSTSAFAASKVVAVHHSTRTLAEGEAAPAADKPAKEEKKSKKAKKEKAPKADKGAKDEKAPEAK